MKPLKALIILMFLLSIQLSFSQKEDAYFQKIVDTTSNKELKLAALDSLIHDTNNQKDLIVFAERTEQFVDLAIEMGEYEKAIEFTVRGFFNINIRLNQNDRALNLVEKVEPYLEKINDPYLEAGLYLKKGGGYFNGKSYKKAVENYTKAVETYENKDSIYKADAIFFRGQAQFNLGNHLKAIEDYKTAGIYYENLGDITYALYTEAEIISIYGINGFTEKTIQEHLNLIEKKKRLNHKKGLTVDYFNLAGNYKKINNREKQEEYLLKAAESEEENSQEFSSSTQVYAALAKFYSDSDIQKAKEYLDKSKETLENSGKQTLTGLYYNQARAYYLFKTNKYEEALQLAKNNLKIFEENSDTDGLIKTNMLIYDIYKKKNDAKNALSYYQKYNQLQDSIYSVTKTNALSYYQTLYETEKQEKEIAQQQADLDILAEKNEAKRRLILFGGIGLLLAFIIFYLYRNKVQLKKKQAMQEKFSQQLLLSQEQERKRISKDLHDSLGQSLLLIKNKVSLKKDEQTQELVNNAIEEMRSISRVLHPFQLEDIGISKALENLINQLDESYQDIYIFGNIEDLQRELNTNKEINIFRIVQECLSNIIKHAKAKSAKIDLIVVDNHINLSIKDNGVGFDFSEKYNDFKSLGLKTIKERVKFLDGILKIDSEKGKGTTFNISFPIL